MISFDQFYFLSSRYHPNLIPHGRLRPGVMLPHSINTLWSQFRSLQNASALRMGEKSAESITGPRQLGVPKTRRAFTHYVEGRSAGGSRGFLYPGGDTSCPVISWDPGRGRCSRSAPACHRGDPLCRQDTDPCAPFSLRSPLVFSMLFMPVIIGSTG